MAAPTIGTPSRLSGSALSISSLRDDARAELEALLAAAPGKICLVIDPFLLPVLRLVITEGSRYLREHAVDSVVELSDAPIAPGDAESVVFLTRSGPVEVQRVAVAVRALVRARGARASARVAFVPRRTFAAEVALRDAGVLADVTLTEWVLDVLPLDDDVLTLVAGTGAGGTGAVADVMETVAAVARAVIRLQDAFGPIPLLRGKGRYAKGVIAALARSAREDEAAAEPRTRAARARNDPTSTTALNGDAMGTGTSLGSNTMPPPRSEIDMLVVIDRAADLVTPLVSPLTFEALLREETGTDWLMASVDAAIAADPENAVAASTSHGASPSPASPPYLASGARATLHLNSNDKLYREIRDAHIDVAGAHLAARARELQAFRDDIRKRNADMDVAAIHKFVKAIPTHQAEGKSLRVLVELCSRVRARVNDVAFSDKWARERGLLDGDAGSRKAALDAASEAFAAGAPLVSALRLVCLASVTGGGLRRAELESLRRDVAAFYGFTALLTLHNLEAAGLLGAAAGDGVVASLLTGGGGGGSAAWGALRKAFVLMAEGDVDAANPRDLHFLTSGYAPLSLRIVQAAVTGGWEQGMGEALKLVAGPTVSATNKVLRKDDDYETTANATGSGIGAAAGARKVVLVAFVGGVTHIEISGLRFISEKCERTRAPSTKRKVGSQVISGAKCKRERSALAYPPPPPPPVPVDFLILTTSLIDGDSYLRTFIDPLHAEHGLLGGTENDGEGGAAEEDDAAPVMPLKTVLTREQLAAASRAEAVAASIAGAGKLGVRPPQAPATKKEEKSLFGGWGR